MIAAVARIFQPGIKFDQALILEGPQGFNKSSLIKALASPDWFSDALTVQANSQVVIEQTTGKWLVELAELSGLGPSKVEHVKAFLSQSTDSARLAYRHDSVERPRQFILIGTVNDAEYLMDPTGNRRFWPVRVQKFIELNFIAAARNQLWGEAVHRYKKGESIELPRELWDTAQREQEQRRLRDPWIDLLEDRLGDQDGKVKIESLFEFLDINRNRQDRWVSKRLKEVMTELGFEKTRSRDGDKRPRCFQRGSNPTGWLDDLLERYREH